MLVRFKSDLDDQLVSFSALTLDLVIWPVKIVPEMTYNVLSGTLSNQPNTFCVLKRLANHEIKLK